MFNKLKLQYFSANLSPISSTEDECEKVALHPKIRKIILHRVQCEIKELQPWILADPLPNESNKPDMADICLQTDYFNAPTTNKAVNTESLNVTDSETQYEIDIISTTINKSAFETIMEELSEEIYLDQLLAIRQKDFSIPQTIVVRPESLGDDAKIVNFIFLKKYVSLF
uniref:Uncharacterized protein n=1 Tax=Panagrolaimus superbus TaxID=310955 RepID=A0A914YHN2_9BILA